MPVLFLVTFVIHDEIFLLINCLFAGMSNEKGEYGFMTEMELDEFAGSYPTFSSQYRSLVNMTKAYFCYYSPRPSGKLIVA